MKLRDGEAMLSVAFEEARQSANCDGNQVEEPLYKETGKSALEARRAHAKKVMGHAAQCSDLRSQKS
jgi:hypothetical protein